MANPIYNPKSLKAEEFINKPNIEVVDIKYARSNNDTSILVIYRDKEKEKVC